MVLSFYSACTILVLCLSYYIVKYPISPTLAPKILNSISSNTNSCSSVKVTTLTSAKFGYLADLRVGSRSTKQSLVVDTGSSLLWINCVPCQLHAPEPLFDPKSSTSFEAEDCANSDICHGTGAVRVGPCMKQRCMYILKYGGAYSKGYLARDTVDLGNNNISEKMVFGCARESEKLDSSTNGVLGLGSNKLSLISQMNASRFSYCFGNISDASYPYSFLSVGDDCIRVSANKTRLMVEDKYFVNLISIRFGEKVLDTDASIFRRNSDDYTGGMIVDTGSTYTYIPLAVLQKLEKRVDSLIEPAVPRNDSITYRNQYTMLCYNGVLTRDLRGFPKVQLAFEGGAVMEVGAENVFYQLNYESFCLGVLPSEVLQTTSSILGNLMQQFFYVAIDMELKEFHFQNVDCALLINE